MSTGENPIAAIGGELLVGSGFDDEEPDRDATEPGDQDTEESGR